MANKGLSCLICTHKAPPSMEALLDSLEKQDWQPGDEVIVIDNGVSYERLVEIEKALDRLRHAQVKVLLEKEERVGLTSARLKSFILASNSWLVLLDDDNILAPDAVKCIRQVISEHPELGGICPQIAPKWERAPPEWIVAIGHQVLSYNTSHLSQPPYSFAIWKPGIVGAHPPGGGMIVHRRATDEFVKLAASIPYLQNLGRRGSKFSAGEDFIIYGFLYRMGLSTAYDDSILIYHQIPDHRMKFLHLLRLLYYCNLSFGVMGIMRFGRWNVLYSGLRGTARLAYEMLTQSFRVLSWRIPIAFAVALCGYWSGTLSGFFDRRCVYLPINTVEQQTTVF
jgi:glycosyltransferase involved in cell wall biosynthesis